MPMPIRYQTTLLPIGVPFFSGVGFTFGGLFSGSMPLFQRLRFNHSCETETGSGARPILFALSARSSSYVA